MKKCNACGATQDDQAKFCTFCGSGEFTSAGPESTVAAPAVAAPEGNVNILAGAVGAFLFSLIGVALYFVLYQLDIIAAISGLVMVVMANFGYGLFAKTKNKASVPGLIISVIMAIIMIFLSEYLCLAYDIYGVFNDWGISFAEAFRAVPDFLEEPEISEAFVSDLVYAYVFGAIASVSYIINIVKARKNKQ